MIKIAIVEDNEKDVKMLRECLTRYGLQNGLEFDISVFENGMDFISNYKKCYDIIFMDIEMPILNGMDTARRLREQDDVTQLIFITNLSQYAINGYEVDACDYILKPISYFALALRFAKVVNKVKKSDDYILISKGGGIGKIKTDTICYIEVMGHMLTYHTTAGNFSVRGTISSLEQKLSGQNFARCNVHYLVNLAYVTSIKGLTVYVGGTEIPMSRGRRAEFRDKLNKYEISCAKGNVV